MSLQIECLAPTCWSMHSTCLFNKLYSKLLRYFFVFGGLGSPGTSELGSTGRCDAKFISLENLFAEIFFHYLYHLAWAWKSRSYLETEYLKLKNLEPEYSLNCRRTSGNWEINCQRNCQNYLGSIWLGFCHIYSCKMVLWIWTSYWCHK